MNPAILLHDIKVKLEANNFFSVIKKIDEKIRSGSTSGEIWSGVGYYLKHLNRENSIAYDLIKAEIEMLDNHLRSIGLILA